MPEGFMKTSLFSWVRTFLFFPAKEIMLYDVEAKSYDTVYQRLAVIDRISRGDYGFVVTSVEALSHKMIRPEMFREYVTEIDQNTRMEMEELVRRLVVSAYERVESVERKGQFAVRGGIVDIFPVDSENAVRLEFFGDEIDSVRWFDTNTQRSTGRVERVRILPAREMIFDQEKKNKILKAVKNDLTAASKKNHSLSQKIEADIERFRESWYFPGIDRYISYIADEPAFLTDYAGDDAVIFLDEPVRQEQRLENLLLEHEEICKALLGKGMLMPQSFGMFFDYTAVFSIITKKKTVYLNTVNPDSIASRDSKAYSIPAG
jgi:transcription-repair coupling factor (superfamily II helicase)